MNKSELVAAIAEKAGVTKKQAEAMVNAYNDVVINEVAKGSGSVSLVGFGTFTTSARAERQGRNPQTGETITIPAKNVPKFNPGKAFKDAVN